ncbi:transposase [Bifidobacterium bifidum]
MCTPRYDITLDRFMRVAHPLPRRRGNHTFVNALPWMCRAGAPWRGLPECYGKWVTVYRRFDRWSGDGAMEHLLMAARTRGIPPGRRPSRSA